MPVLQVFINEEQNRILQIYKALNKIRSNEKAIPIIIDTLVKNEIVESNN